MQKYPRYTGVLRLKNLIPEGNNGAKGYVSDDVPRMYNKNYFEFDFPIHEQLRFKDRTKSDDVMEAFLLPIEVIHHGYALTGDDMRKNRRETSNSWREASRRIRRTDIIISRWDSQTLCLATLTKRSRHMRREWSL